MIPYVPEYALWRLDCRKLREETEAMSRDLTARAHGYLRTVERNLVGGAR